MTSSPEHRIEAELVSHIPALRNFARRFHNSPNDVDDQETLAKALNNLDKFEAGTRMKSWLFTIMRNTFCTRYGLTKREQVGLTPDCENRISIKPSQEDFVRAQELEEAIYKLPEKFRTVIELIFIQEVSYEVAANKCGCPIGTIKSRVSRARNMLCKALD
ncbi:sigma-70 family RNA polymerase sigma factor [Rhizobium sp. Root1204]|uniref:sigma-70 family RNA polymerase sigma factor n=1 Tax=Rhizobium sp. Root1204 TaxID=1736428 RepID=UPI00071289A9|nr:sigma-70 family RNA polymerase sigma factor [Rhizobium sp. Root1204]KQV36417.1 RNA polymerase subunit sigma [Rhizobium sp. Root1204]